MNKDKDTPKSHTENRGLKRLRNPGSVGVRKEHPEWNRPNKKHAARIAERQKMFDATSDKSPHGHLHHRPGSWKKV